MKKHLTLGRLAGYLLYLSLAGTLFFGVTYARYSSTVTGTGTAEVAALEMNTTLDLTGRLQGLAPGEKRTVGFEVTNFLETSVSEVSQEYSVTVTTTGNLPLTFELTPSKTEAEGTFADAPSGASSTVTWKGGSLPYGAATTHTYTLTVTLPSGQAASYADEIDLVTLTINAQQTKPGNTIK